jgi:Domain of unknown function (DUF4112)
MKRRLRPDQEARLKRVRWLARILDEVFRIPGTKIRFGLDGILGLVPVAGDVACSLVSLYIIRESARLGAPGPILLQMTFNVAADLVVGAVPVAGDLADLAWKANLKNVQLLEAWLEEQNRTENQPVIDV